MRNFETKATSQGSNRVLDFNVTGTSDVWGYEENVAEVEVTMGVNALKALQLMDIPIVEALMEYASNHKIEIDLDDDNVTVPVATLHNVTVREGRKEGEYWVNTQKTWVSPDKARAQGIETDKALYLPTITFLEFADDGSLIQSWASVNQLSSVVTAKVEAAKNPVEKALDEQMDKAIEADDEIPF